MEEKENIIQNIKKNTPPKYHTDIDNAINIATKYHQGQNRYSGEPYILHPLRVALDIASRKFDTTTIISAILHNVITNNPWRKEDIQKEILLHFDKEILDILDRI